MASGSLKDRVAALEAQVARLKQQLEATTKKPDPWEKLYGSFADDPDYEEAMRLGREWRESFRPKAKSSKKKGGNDRPRHRSSKAAARSKQQ